MIRIVVVALAAAMIGLGGTMTVLHYQSHRSQTTQACQQYQQLERDGAYQPDGTPIPYGAYEYELEQATAACGQ